MNPQVIILVAGRGSRLGALTENRPKCMVELRGHALLEWQLRSIEQVGLKDITLVTGYRARALDCIGWPTINNEKWAETNIVKSLLCAREHFAGDRDLIVSYGDIVYEPHVLETLLKTTGDIVTVIDLEWLSLWQMRNQNPLNDAETLRLGLDNVITDIGRQPTRLDEIQGQYIGLTKFTAKGKRVLLDFVDQVDGKPWPLPKPLAETHFTDLLRGLIVAGQTVGAATVRGGWLEVDTPEDLQKYECSLADGRIGSLLRLGEVSTW